MADDKERTANGGLHCSDGIPSNPSAEKPKQEREDSPFDKHTALKSRKDKTLEHYRLPFESMPWEQPTTGMRVKTYEQDGRRLRLVDFTKDFVEPEWCTKGHIGYVLEGEMEVDFHGQGVTFRAGDGLFIPPGEEHGHKARVLTDTARVFLVEAI